MHRSTWTAWTISLDRVVVELDERATPRGLALELDVRLGARGVLWATWRLEDGTPLGRVRIGVG